ncbi:MAG: hypothetical protein QW828_08445 [Candidatus Bathyarchaeia archaeon]
MRLLVYDYLHEVKFMQTGELTRVKSPCYCGQTEAYLKDDAIQLLEVTTINSSYLFLQERISRSGLLVWRVLEGRDSLLGRTVSLLAIGSDVYRLAVGGRVAIYDMARSYEPPLYTSRILAIRLEYGVC